MSKNKREILREIPALKVRQWLADWEEVEWSEDEHRAKPKDCFYQFSISANDLKALSGIYARTTKDRESAAEDLGIQRRHEAGRSDEIALFVKYGFPWSELTEAKRKSGKFSDLRKPGWLPTAIVVNILLLDDERRGGKKVAEEDLVKLEDGENGLAKVHLPEGFTGKDWESTALRPIEIIDGQHRLWAFGQSELDGEFQLPVVAFVGLDISWQAYLFYTINIKPKRINASLAYDMYPLLRTESWLEKSEGHVIYRETRAQELVDILWSHPDSPWHEWINMLGEPGHRGRMVTQSAWIRSLLATFIKSWKGRGTGIGGLFGAPVGTDDQTLPWSRAEQAAFIIVIGQHLRNAIKGCSEKWAVSLREPKDSDLSIQDQDMAFYGPNSLLNQDQGVRAVLHVVNDLCHIKCDDLGLSGWGGDSDLYSNDKEQVRAAIRAAIETLKEQREISEFLKLISKAIATYDWRASSTPGLTEDESRLKAAFRGTGGFKELRRHLLRHLVESKSAVAEDAAEVLNRLGY